MTRSDIALAVLPALMKHEKKTLKTSQGETPEFCKQVVRGAFAYADAFLKEKEKQ